jgi:hypothetical protein
MENIIDKIICQINKEENKSKINEQILNPIFQKFTNRIYPYVSLLFLMYILNLILVIIILTLIYLKN